MRSAYILRHHWDGTHSVVEARGKELVDRGLHAELGVGALGALLLSGVHRRLVEVGHESHGLGVD